MTTLPTARNCFGLLLAFLFTLIRGLVDDAIADEPPTGPQPPTVTRSLAGLFTQDGCTIELAAAEPNVIDPIAIRFDMRGRMWVVEMRDYPTGPVDGRPFGGQIRILTDTNDDGVYDESKTFADGLVFPTGVQPWRDGAIVTLAGKIEFMRDTNGDDQCDQHELWFTGFDEDNEQLRANHPTLGPDGLVYVAGGLRGGRIKAVDSRWATGQSGVNIDGTDFAFDPEGGFFAGVAGASQHGFSVDDFGRRVGCSNRNPAIETILTLSETKSDRWVQRERTLHDMAASGGQSKVVAIAPSWTTSHTHAGQFSAACGLTVGLGPAWPDKWQNDLVVCEPTAYAVQRQTIARDGILRTANRVDDAMEFVASDHDWFRPVDTAVGVDGALYIADMCRAVIEHPDWAPRELKNRPDERWGDQQGRIWRVWSGDQTIQTSFEPAEQSSAGWLKRLDDPNPTVRQLASRWLFEQTDRQWSQLPTQHADIIDSLSERGSARWHQAWQKRNRDIDPPTALVPTNGSGELRELAVRLDSKKLFRTGELDHIKRLHRWLDDPDPTVRFAAIELAGNHFEVADATPAIEIADHLASVLVDMEFTPASLPYWSARVSCLPPKLVSLFSIEFASRCDTDIHDLSLVVATARRAAHTDQYRDIRPAIGVNTVELKPAVAVAFAAGYAEGHQAAGRSHQQVADCPVAPLVQHWIELAKANADSILCDESNETSGRLNALRVIDWFDLDRWDQMLALVDQTSSDQVRQAVLPRLFHLSIANHDRHRQWRRYIDDHWMSSSPSIVTATIDLMIKKSDWSETLLDAFENGKIPTTIATPNQVEQLRQHHLPSIVARAETLFTAARSNRVAVIGDYQSTLSGVADLHSGRRHFTQHCAACHRIADVGVAVGPDISDSRSKTPSYLLTAILDPNAAVDAGFLGYQVLTEDGELVTGTMAEQTADYVTLQINGGQKRTYDRDQTETIRSTGLSIMPEGFERGLTPVQMRDLIGFLKGWRYMEQGRATMDMRDL